MVICFSTSYGHLFRNLTHPTIQRRRDRERRERVRRRRERERERLRLTLRLLRDFFDELLELEESEDSELTSAFGGFTGFPPVKASSRFCISSSSGILIVELFLCRDDSDSVSLSSASERRFRRFFFTLGLLLLPVAFVFECSAAWRTNSRRCCMDFALLLGGATSGIEDGEGAGPGGAGGALGLPDFDVGNAFPSTTATDSLCFLRSL